MELFEELTGREPDHSGDELVVWDQQARRMFELPYREQAQTRGINLAVRACGCARLGSGLLLAHGAPAWLRLLRLLQRGA